ncbi:MAG: GNAT family N-acetyltransferase [bacterium]|nr:GNAT family N-acetyltransferase [bacterium]
MKVQVKRFDELSITELYQLLKLRCDIFVVEQECAYQDIDDKDQKALHVLGTNNGVLVAYTRMFDAGDYFDQPSIGRVAVHQDHRKYGYGHQIIESSIEAAHNRFGKQPIKISAQTYLQKFYESHGFEKTSEEYLEDDIPHIDMIKS